MAPAGADEIERRRPSIAWPPRTQTTVDHAPPVAHTGLAAGMTQAPLMASPYNPIRASHSATDADSTASNYSSIVQTRSAPFRPVRTRRRRAV
jgi:hypothetical protein